MEQATTRISSYRLPLKWGVLLVVGLLIVGWLFNTPPGLLGKADAVGYAVCHRIEYRSFHFENGLALPLCARCTGMYLGSALGILYQSVVGRRRSGMPSLAIWLVMSLLVIAFGVDGVNSYFHLSVMEQLLPFIPRLYEPSNLMRLITGTGMGLVIAAALVPVFNQTIWKKLDPRPVLSNRAFGVLILFAMATVLLVLTENPLVLYPAAMISSLSVLLILSMVYSMVWVMLLRKDNHYETLPQLAMPLLAGFGVALLQIAVLDAARYWLTGTWSGFPL
jgi:uncharacterized membrane protein